MRGTGGLYRRGAIWWIRYSHRGQEFRESSESESETSPANCLTPASRKPGGAGNFSALPRKSCCFDDLAATLMSDYTINEFAACAGLTGSLKHLRAYFGLDRAIDITTDRIRAYVVKRREAGAAKCDRKPRTGRAQTRLHDRRQSRTPVPRAAHRDARRERNARQGFLDHAEFVALRDALPEHLRDPIAFLYLSGWRVAR